MKEVKLTTSQILLVMSMKKNNFSAEENTYLNTDKEYITTYYMMEVVKHKKSSRTTRRFYYTRRKFKIHHMVLKALIKKGILRPTELYDTDNGKRIKINSVEELRAQKAVGSLPSERTITYKVNKKVKFLIPTVTARVPEQRHK